MSRSLPVRPNLDQYRKQAKELLEQWQAGAAAARRRFAEHHPRFGVNRVDDVKVVLADAQLVLAREHGFPTWAEFAREVGRRSGSGGDATTWLAAQRAVIAGDANALDALMRAHSKLFKEGYPPAFGPERGRLAPAYGGPDARSIIASNHHFDSWEAFIRWLTARATPGSPVARFEAAVDAIVDGDLETLRRLLRAHPDLVTARSERRHHSTLLHYVGANGIENYRQKTPANAVEIARVLLDAGAVVDAAAGMYGGGSTTLGLVATSIHPLLAGVQDDLMALLIERGAAVDEPGAGGNAQRAVASALANNRPQAAAFLARRGARLDLDTAAGIGDLEAVRRFVGDDGALRSGATAEQRTRGVAWAAQFDRAHVLAFLLEHGTVASSPRDGATPLHWAAYSGSAASVDVLLRHRAPVNAKDRDFAGTPLGWALYGWGTRDLDRDREPYYGVVATLVRAGGTVAPEWLDEGERGVPLERLIAGDPRMEAALGWTRR
jgi:ankyrin repeat protein